MEGLRYQVAKQREHLGVEVNKKNPLPEGQELVHELFENAQKLLLLVKKDEEKEKE